MEQPIRASDQNRILAVLGVILFILAVVGVLAAWTTTRMIRDRDGIAHDHQVLAALHDARALLDDAEDQERGYLITGDASLLEAFQGDGVAGRFGRKLAALRGMLAEQPEQLRRLDQLAATAAGKFGNMEAIIETRRRLGPDQARDQVVDQLRKQPRDPAGTALLELIAAEQGILEQRIARARVNDLRAMLLLAALLICLLTFLLTFFWMTWKNLRRQARAATQLRKSREQFELAVRGSNDGLWDWDIETDTVFFSPRWKSQLGYQDGEITHHFREFESRLHPEDRDRVMDALDDYFRSRSPHYSVEFRMRTKDGSYRWILARGMALRDAEGNPFRMAGSHTDITERKEVESKLAEQNRLLERAMRAERETNEALRQAQAVMVHNEKMAGLGQMVAGVAHEINNPLAFITNNVTVLQRDFHELQQMLRLYESAREAIARGSPDLERQISEFRAQVEFDETVAALPELLNRTSEGLKRIRQLVKDLRLFARLDEGEVNEADLNEGIKSTVTIIKGHARDKDIRLKLALEPLPPVTCHAARINQVVMNLISNAIDACSPGGTIVVRSGLRDGQAQIEVSDDGHGINTSILGRIFDPFFTTKPIGRGTGLGLSISYSIIRDHGGTITVDSAPGRGSRFTVRLPLNPKEKTSESPILAEPPPAPTATASTPGPVRHEPQPS